MTKIPSESELEAISAKLLEFNPLESRRMKVFGEASYPYRPSPNSGRSFWGIRRNCSYSVTAGMLPGTQSVLVAAANEDDLHRFGWELRKTAIEEIGEVLGMEPESGEEDRVALDHSLSGNVDFLITPIWSVTVQVTWESSEYATASLIVLSFFVLLREQQADDRHA